MTVAVSIDDVSVNGVGLNGAETTAPVLDGGEGADDVGIEQTRDLVGIADGVV